MMIDVNEVSSGLFVRGLTNLKTLLTKAQEHASTSCEERALLNARLAPADMVARAGHPSADVHLYTLAAQVHWAAEGARLAICHLSDGPREPVPSSETSFAELHHYLDETIHFIGQARSDELLAGLGRTIVIERPGGAIQAVGAHFLIAYAIPHFFYHLTATYSILRNAGLKLRMADFLGNWGALGPAVHLTN